MDRIPSQTIFFLTNLSSEKIIFINFLDSWAPIQIEICHKLFDDVSKTPLHSNSSEMLNFHLLLFPFKLVERERELDKKVHFYLEKLLLKLGAISTLYNISKNVTSIHFDFLIIIVAGLYWFVLKEFCKKKQKTRANISIILQR